jgi:hypothetical protein
MTSDPDIEPLWTAKQTAEYLGVTEIALYRMRRSGKGPLFSMVPGRQKVRYRPSVVQRWVADGEAPSMAAHYKADSERAQNAVKQREGAAHARVLRWKDRQPKRNP